MHVVFENRCNGGLIQYVRRFILTCLMLMRGILVPPRPASMRMRMNSLERYWGAFFFNPVMNACLKLRTVVERADVFKCVQELFANSACIVSWHRA